jgi:hypothetical protein
MITQDKYIFCQSIFILGSKQCQTHLKFISIINKKKLKFRRTKNVLFFLETKIKFQYIFIVQINP